MGSCVNITKCKEQSFFSYKPDFENKQKSTQKHNLMQKYEEKEQALEKRLIQKEQFRKTVLVPKLKIEESELYLKRKHSLKV